MAKESRPSELKSAYELALERLETQGIDRPDQGALSDEVRAALDEQRRTAEAKLAELEILHGKAMLEMVDSAARAQAEQEYAAERRRIEERRDREIDRLRRSPDNPDPGQS